MTAEPELRTTPSGKSVCNFSVAVNRRNKVEGQPDVDFFRIAAWNQLGENCGKHLAKGKKVCVVGSVSLRTYQGSDGKTRANIEIMATDVEFLSPRDEHREQNNPEPIPVSVPEGDLPF